MGGGALPPQLGIPRTMDIPLAGDFKNMAEPTLQLMTTRGLSSACCRTGAVVR